MLADPRGTLWVTAEGRFTDPRQRPLTLRPGISHLARHVPNLVFMPLAIEYCFWNESRPEALARFGPAMAFSEDLDPAEINARLTAALTDTMDALAREAMTRDPALFRPLLRGGSGVGGVYDMWRRLGSWFRGQRFDPAHARRTPHPGDD